MDDQSSKQDQGSGGTTTPEAEAPATRQLSSLSHKIDILRDTSQELAKKLSPILPTEKTPPTGDSDKKSAGIAGSSPVTVDLRKLSISVERVNKTLRRLIENAEV